MSARVLVLAGVLLVSACAQSSGTGASTASVPVPSAVRSSAPAPAVTPAVAAPLTGRPWSGDPRTVRRGTVVGVLSDSGTGSLPASVAGADLVLQELDGAQLRFLAAFQSTLPTSVAPLGDLRGSDQLAMAMLTPGVLYSFAYPQVLTDLRGSGVTDLGPGSVARAAYSGATQADASRAAAAVGLPPTPEGLFGYAGPGDQLAATGARPVGEVSLGLSGPPAQTWAWDATHGVWTLRTRGPQTASATNLIVLFVDYRPTTRHRTDGSVILAPKVLGRGSCVAFAAGTTTPCNWFRPESSALPVFSDPSGVPLRFQRGSTWIALVPTGTAVSSK